MMGSFNRTAANKFLCKAKSKDEEFVTQKQGYSPLRLRHNGQVGNKRRKISEY